VDGKGVQAGVESLEARATSDSTQVFADAAAYTASVPEESSLGGKAGHPQVFSSGLPSSAFLISLVVSFY
jgi:hypothetical protein